MRGNKCGPCRRAAFGGGKDDTASALLTYSLAFYKLCLVKMKRQTQSAFDFRMWGGRRKGAGRKPSGSRPAAPHRARPAHDPRHPLHVTLRAVPGLPSLRGKRGFPLLRSALAAGSKAAFRVAQFSVQGNHIHLLVEADDSSTLSRGVKGLSVRIARRMNRLMSRTGRVVGDRFHAHLLRTPSEVRRAIHYIRDNHRKHAAERGERVPAGWVDPYSSDSPLLAIVLPAPQSWLLTIGVGKRRAERAGPAKM